MREKVEAEYNASQVNAVTQGLDGNPVVLIQVGCLHICQATRTTPPLHLATAAASDTTSAAMMQGHVVIMLYSFR